jgi:hypothetical protein
VLFLKRRNEITRDFVHGGIGLIPVGPTELTDGQHKVRVQRGGQFSSTEYIFLSNISQHYNLYR